MWFSFFLSLFSSECDTWWSVSVGPSQGYSINQPTPVLSWVWLLTLDSWLVSVCLSVFFTYFRYCICYSEFNTPTILDPLQDILIQQKSVIHALSLYNIYKFKSFLHRSINHYKIYFVFFSNTWLILLYGNITNGDSQFQVISYDLSQIIISVVWHYYKYILPSICILLPVTTTPIPMPMPTGHCLQSFAPVIDDHVPALPQEFNFRPPLLFFTL